MSEETVVDSLPFCEIPGCGEKARYDGKTQMGPHAAMCEVHFGRFGIGLGTGKGQRLVLESEKGDKGVAKKSGAAVAEPTAVTEETPANEGAAEETRNLVEVAYVLLFDAKDLTDKQIKSGVNATAKKFTPESDAVEIVSVTGSFVRK